MRSFISAAAERLPPHFRVLYRQFLLRVVDLEALSVDADVPALLGQFAGLLILISVFRALGLLINSGRPHLTPADLAAMTWSAQHSFLSLTMLVAGLIAVISWDNIFPDRRDVMVLGPLPVRPRTILLARMAACGSLLAIGILSLNLAISVAVSILPGGIPGFPRHFAAYWFSITSAALFVYGAVLAVQGWTALLLPRKWFLRISAVLQLAAFALFLASYFLEPDPGTPAAAAAAASHGWLNCWPSFWFLAMMNQAGGHAPAALQGLAHRAWIGLGLVLCAVAASLVQCYLRTMKKTVEEPDLVPGAGGWKWAPRLGTPFRTAIVYFSMRSLVRSRQHRVVYAFFLSVAFAVAVSTLRAELISGSRRPITADFMMPTYVMMCLAVVGLRSIFSLPVSLHANWVLQVTRLRAPQHYIAATRQALLTMAVAPMWITAALLSFGFEPWPQVTAHLAALALIGSILADLSLIGVAKVPFACSYLPGKSNIQYMFWAFAVIFLPIAMMFSNYEQRATQHAGSCALMLAILAAITGAVWAFNRSRSKSAVLYFEEQPPVIITTLGLASSPLRAAIEMPHPRPGIHPS